MRRILVVGFLLLAGGILYSCVTVSSVPAPPLAEVTRSHLDQSISAKNLKEGFNDWSRATLRKYLPDDYLHEVGTKFFSLLAPTDDAQKEPSYRAWDRVSHAEDMLHFASFAPAADQAGLQTRLDGEYRAYLKTLLDQDMSQIAIMFALSHPSILNDQLRGDLIERAKAIPNPWAQRELARTGNTSDVSGQAMPQIDPSAILKACVTVWVDRGIKMEQGVGTLDRVIGSAFFIEKSGYLLTNYHVISSEVDPSYKGFSRLYVRIGSAQSEKIPAKVIGWDPVFDLALLKTEVTAPALVPLSNLEGALSGTRVLAFGSPGGLDNTVTAGIVSAQGRRFIPMGDILQIDAPVNPGNSGGPLLTADGEFLGIVFAGIQQFQGVNFSVPASWIAGLLPRLYRGGLVHHPWIGFQLFEYRGQVRVSYVSPGSPAYQLGISAGSILTKIQGIPVATLTQAYKAISSISPGQICSLDWIEGVTGLLGLAPSTPPAHAYVILDERPEHPLEAAARAGLDLKLVVPFFGMRLSDISTSGLSVNLRVEEVIPGSSADESGFAAGDTFQVLDWHYDPKSKAIYFSLNAARRSQAFFPQSMQIANLVDGEDLL